MQSRNSNLILWFIAITLLFPLFVQISGGIYNNPIPVHDSGGLLDKLPLPISIGACVFGILALGKNYRQATPAILFILAFGAAMLLSLFFAGESPDVERRKVVLAAQILLPTMGLVLGQLVRDEQNVIPRAFMWVLLLMVPFQLCAGWWQQTRTLTHYLYAFSIYQHFQFVPVIFVLAFCIVMVHLWDQHKVLLRPLAAVMAIYVIASASLLAIGLYSGFVALFFLQRTWRLKTTRWIGFLMFGAGMLAVVILMSLYYSFAKDYSFNNNNISDFGGNNQYIGKFKKLAEGKMPVNVEERLADWTMFLKGTTENYRTLMFGHVEPLPREVRTSAHNWYLDFAYNFGLIALLPVVALIVFTMYLVWRFRRSLPGETWWLAGLLAFMVFVDSNLKVTLRQPYPGIIVYFLWGLLLSRLRFQAGLRLVN